MRHYEVMVILDPELDERTIAPSLDTFLSVIKKDGGTVEKVDIWGRRRLAFEIKKKSEGIYAVIDLNAEPASVIELDRQLNLNESVLRTKVLRPVPQKQKAKKAAAKKAAAKKSQPDGRRNDHHRGRQPDRRPGAAVHPVRCRGRLVHGRLHPAHLRPADQRVEGRRRAVPALLDLAAGGRERRRVAAARHAGRGDRDGSSSARIETREGEKRTVVEMQVDEVGPSLRYATAKVNRTQRGSSGGGGGGFGGDSRRRCRSGR